jgi:hypothetical protein
MPDCISNRRKSQRKKRVQFSGRSILGSHHNSEYRACRARRLVLELCAHHRRQAELGSK